MVGATFSVTITLVLQVAVAPPGVVTVQVTAVVPTGNELGALLVITSPVQKLVKVGVGRVAVAVHTEVSLYRMIILSIP